MLVNSSSIVLIHKVQCEHKIKEYEEEKNIFTVTTILVLVK
jgi:hypothetical protein